MFLNLTKKEFQHLVLQYILQNLRRYDELNERSLNEDDIIEEPGQWKDEDEVWHYMITFLKRRNVETRLAQTWPKWEGRIKMLGLHLSNRIIDVRQTKQEGDDPADKVKIAF